MMEEDEKSMLWGNMPCMQGRRSHVINLIVLKAIFRKNFGSKINVVLGRRCVTNIRYGSQTKHFLLSGSCPVTGLFSCQTGLFKCKV